MLAIAPAEVGGTAVRIEFANANGDCKLGAALGASDGASFVDVPFEDGAMFSTAAQLRCDAVAYESTRLRAHERGTNQYGLGSVNNFSSYTSDGFEVYDVPEPPPDLVAVSPPLLASAALVAAETAAEKRLCPVNPAKHFNMLCGPMVQIADKIRTTQTYWDWSVAIPSISSNDSTSLNSRERE